MRRISFRVSDELYEELKAFCDEIHRTPSNLALHATEEYLRRYKRKTGQNTSSGE